MTGSFLYLSVFTAGLEGEEEVSFHTTAALLFSFRSGKATVKQLKDCCFVVLLHFC